MVIRPRDVEILASVARAKFLSTAQIAELHCRGSVRVAQRRLRALLDHGLVVASLQAELLHRPSIFRPTARGIDLLADHGHLDMPKPGRLPKPGKLRHAVATRDVFVAAHALERAGTWRLEVVLFDTELSADPVLRAAQLVPDVLIRTRPKLGAEALLVFVEVDLGSEPISTLGAKVDRYELLGEASGDYSAAELLLVVEGERRRERVQRIDCDRRIRAIGWEELYGALQKCSRGVCGPTRRAERTALAPQVRELTATSCLRRPGV